MLDVIFGAIIFAVVFGVLIAIVDTFKKPEDPHEDN